VVSVQRSFGRALHTGHRTESIRFNESALGATPVIIQHRQGAEMVTFALFGPYLRQNGNVRGTGSARGIRYWSPDPQEHTPAPLPNFCIMEHSAART
jgi:hypothetical protein